MNWKTTLFGIFQGVGGALMFAYVTLLIHPDALPHWVKYTAAITFLVGCIGDGICGADWRDVKRELDKKQDKR